MVAKTTIAPRPGTVSPKSWVGPLSKSSIVRRLESAVARPMPADDLQRVAAVGAVAAIIDVRPPEAYARGHIQGSVNIPETKITALVHALTNHPGAVLVCDDGRCSAASARAMSLTGMKDVYFLEGGLAAWKEIGAPLMETTERGTERRVARTERFAAVAGVARLFSVKVLFMGLAASAAMIALALRFLA
jgi:rhodanese-related sulfurtransferase